MLQKNCHFDSKFEQFRTFCLHFWPWSWKGFQILRCLQLSHPCCKPKPCPGDCFLWPQKFGTAGIMWAAAIIPGVNLACALVVTWSTWSHCGSTFGCGEILCFLTNNLGDDVAVLKKCTCRRWLKPLPNGKTEGAIKLCPCKTYGCSDFCQRPAEDHNFDSVKL